MSLKLISTCLLLILSLFSVSAGQEIDEESNWYREIGRGDDFYSRFEYRRYSKEDAIEAKDRYLRLTSLARTDEWEGIYTQGTMLGRAEILWNRKDGFVYHYVYHTLAGLDYGKTYVEDFSVEFKSDRLSRSKPSFFEVEYVKVKFGEKHLLVPRSKLADFALIAVGHKIQSDTNEPIEDYYFWEKVEDEKKPISGLPQFPESYRHLVRRPIEALITTVGRLRKKRLINKESGTTSEEHVRLLTLSKGTRHGVRVGMTFWMDALEERVEIVSVSLDHSTAELSRFLVDGKPYCLNYEAPDGREFPCRAATVGMKARTKTQHF